MKKLVFIFCALLPVSALAETVVIQSDEHEGFSRLVLEFQDRPDWHLSEINDGYSLDLQRGGIDIDLSRVFARIPRLRLTGVAFLRQQSSLVFTLGCACHIDVSNYGDAQIVIDIRDAPVAAEPREGTRLDQASSLMQHSEQPSSEPVLSQFELHNTQRNSAMAGTSFLPNPEELEGDSESSADDTVNELRANLLEQLSRASAQGLVSAPEIVTNGSTALSPETEPEPVILDLPRTQITISSSLDQGNQIAQDAAITTDGVECIDDRYLDVQNWGNADQIAREIGVARMALIPELENVDPDAAINLIKTYLYAGFGAEAEQVSSIVSLSFPQDLMFPAMAQIMDDTSVVQSDAMRAFVQCPGNVAMWGVLAVNDISPGDRVNSNAVVAAFSALPFHLRNLLGPRLIQKFLDFGDINTASVLRNAITRSSSETSDLFQIVEAQFEYESGEAIAAERILLETIQGGGDAVPQALVDYIALRTARDARVPWEVVEAAQAFAYELQNVEQGVQLQKAVILAQLQNQAFDQAIFGLSILHPDALDVLRHAQQKITENASDVTFVRLTYALLDFAGDLSFAEIEPAARRAIDLGHYDLADKLIPPDTLPSLRAELLVSSGNSERALEVIRQSETEDINIELAALNAMGNYRQVANVAQRSGQHEELARALWRQGDWVNLSMLAEGPQKTIADGILTQSSQPNTDDLESYREILGSTVETREMIIDALGEFPAPERGL